MPLSREQMEAVIAGGGSVLHNGQIITKVEHLPSKAQLAKGNPEAEADARKELEAQITALQAQVASLEAGKAAAQEPAEGGDDKDADKAPAKSTGKAAKAEKE